MRGRRVAVVAWIWGLALLALHLDFWRPQRVRLWLGWIPEEAAYRLVWVLLAWIYLLWFCSAVWKEDGDARGEGP